MLRTPIRVILLADPTRRGDGMGWYAWQGGQIGTNGLGCSRGPIRARGLGCASAVDIIVSGAVGIYNTI